MLLLFYALPPIDFTDPLPEIPPILDDDEELLVLMAHFAFFE